LSLLLLLLLLLSLPLPLDPVSEALSLVSGAAGSETLPVSALDEQ
jgi:hypothetical protein